MEPLACLFGVGWALCGIIAAFTSGKPGLWRFTIWLGPLAFFVLRHQD